jgi:hypothetical protein
MLQYSSLSKDCFEGIRASSAISAETDEPHFQNTASHSSITFFYSMTFKKLNFYIFEVKFLS